ncbi:MAG TPA: T9SS type A sorting domain-containing protein, partial [Flavobacterium sp.]|nr:T9SS type A sorting domain-containing protein [Flavobacterium sp.]
TEPIGNTDVRIYPNPTNDVVNIMNHNLEELKIEVFNAVGQQIPISFQNNQLDFSAFDNGMYLLKVYNTQKNQTTHFKIIKK